MRTFRIAGALAFSAVLFGLFPATAAASCVQTTVAERAALAEVVVYGTVTETRQTFAPASGVIRFLPERYLKGTLPGEVEVFLGPTKGGAITSVDYEAVQRGQGHTLYLRSAGDGAWQTDGAAAAMSASRRLRRALSSEQAPLRLQRRLVTTPFSYSAPQRSCWSRSGLLFSCAAATRARRR